MAVFNPFYLLLNLPADTVKNSAGSDLYTCMLV